MEPEIVFFDVETGGLDPQVHPIIQFAGIAVDSGFRVLESLEVKIRFDLSKAEPQALAANHYDAATWKREAVDQAEAAHRITEFCRRHATMEKVSRGSGRPYFVARMAAHNSPFDASFIAAWYKTRGTFFPGACFEALDTLALARWVSLSSATQPKDHKLGSLCEWLGVPLLDAHDALADVRATVEIARLLTQFIREPGG